MAGCTDERGLILRGDVTTGKIDQQEVWIGLWDNASLRGDPIRSMRLSEVRIPASEGNQPFRWPTGLTFSPGLTLYSAVFLEMLHADGIPDRGTAMYPGVPFALELDDENLTSVGNGADEWNGVIAYDFLAGAIPTRAAMQAGYEQLVDALATLPIDAEALLEPFHPVYRDPAGFRYEDLSGWLVKGSMAAVPNQRWRTYPLQDWAVPTWQDRLANVAIATPLEVRYDEIGRRIDRAFIRYTLRSNNVEETVRFRNIYIELENRQARISSLDIASVSLSQGDFSLAVSGPEYWRDEPVVFTWESYNAEASYTVALDRLEAGYWQPVTFAAAVSRASGSRQSGVLASDCSSVDMATWDLVPSTTCLDAAPQRNTFYQIRVQPNETFFEDAFARWFVRAP